MAVTDRLHRLEFSILEPGHYWRVYSLAHGPLAPHPSPTGRFALVANQPPGVIVRPAIYIGWTPDAALWESALRDATPVAGSVSLPPQWTVGRGLATLRLYRPLPILALDHPARRKIIDYGSPEDQRWHGHVTADVYRRTHRASAAVDAQCLASNPDFALPGFRWPSRQLQADNVGVLFTPNFRSDDWSVEGDVLLDSPEGLAAIDHALARGNLLRRASLSSVGGVPDDEDL